METLYPSSYLSSSSLFMQESRSSSSEWTKEENKQFESALAQYDEKTPDRWLRIAAMIPGKTVWDVMKQYKELVEDVGEIEAGNVPIPGYPASSFTLDLMDDRSFDDMYRKKSSTARNSSDQERKKGVPWTEEEHKRFLMGLVKYGKGDWRNISRNFVITKTPTQVASHAQKYFMRQLPGGKDKRRPSIHDITTVNLADTSTISENDNSNDPALLNSCPKNISSQHKSTCGQRIMVFNSTLANNSCEIPSNHSIKMGQNVYASGHYGAYSKPHKSMLSRHQVIG